MDKLGRSRRVAVALLLGILLVVASPASADRYDAPVAQQTPAQAEHTAERRHYLLLFPAGVAVLTLVLILGTRRK